MSLPQETTQHIGLIADETLKTFEQVAELAESKLSSAKRDYKPDIFANINTMTTPVIPRLQEISRANIESYQILTREPAIARVVVADEKGEQQTYYICRKTQIPVPLIKLASRNADIGRLAALPIGGELLLKNGDRLKVLEQVKLHPSMTEQGWDSQKTTVESAYFGPLTIESLRALLKADSQEDLLAPLLARESQKSNVIDGVRRSVITKMALRDQPILDQYQDEIFRLPLNKRLLILGPPGTGKTTTLIRRLGQKLDADFLDDDEKRTIESIVAANGESHSNSWLMFTPTELLKQYLKEAFAREGVPASDQRIRTWSDYRRELARNTFGVLRTATGGSSFIMKNSVDILTDDALADPIACFSDFDEWQRSTFINEILGAARELSINQLIKISTIGQRLLSTIQNTKGGSIVAMFTALASEVAGIQTLVSGMKKVTDKKIDGTLNLQLNRNKSFISELSKFIDALQQTQESENDELDEQEGEEDEASIVRTGIEKAVTAYKQAVRAQARAHSKKRSLGKNTRNGKIIDWLGTRSISEADSDELGASLLIQASARRFMNPVKRYIYGIPKRYKTFRRLRQEESNWYHKGGFNPTDLHPLELDVVLLTILRSANELLSKPDIARNIDAPAWSSLKPVIDLYKNQILVDEVTDFSPLQIACMVELSHPQVRSFFACGDFSQRLTTWGSRSINEIKWVLPDIEIKKITMSYRQSRQLNELAKAIILATGGSDQGVTLQEHVDSEGVKPTLLEGASELTTRIAWLAQRIQEIERFTGQLPSIAIFVEKEAAVQPVADALNAALADENIQVIACHKGQVMGQDNYVRVFDVEHIKGLEFEAVSFIGIDLLATINPNLFDKYLYVGATRAETYLGIICNDVLPDAISKLRRMFVPDWKTS